VVCGFQLVGEFEQTARRLINSYENLKYFLLGESGTGKGLLAKSIHMNSRRQGARSSPTRVLPPVRLI